MIEPTPIGEREEEKLPPPGPYRYIIYIHE